MRRTTLFLLVLGSAVLSATSADAQIYRRRVVYTDPYTTWSYPISSTSLTVSNAGVSATDTPVTTQAVAPAVQTTTTSNGQVVYQSSYTTPSTVYYSYPASNGYYYTYPTTSYSYPSSSYYTYPSSSNYYSYPNGTNWSYPTYSSWPTGYYPVDNWVRDRVGRWR
jgi:hypothetical protein